MLLVNDRAVNSQVARQQRPQDLARLRPCQGSTSSKATNKLAALWDKRCAPQESYSSYYWGFSNTSCAWGQGQFWGFFKDWAYGHSGLSVQSSSEMYLVAGEYVVGDV